MAPDTPSFPTLKPESALTASGRAYISGIDASARGLVVTLFSFSFVWLLISSLFSVIASWKLIDPGFLGHVEVLTYGRVQPAQSSTFLYGWAANSLFAVTLWIISRLSGSVVYGAGATIVATLFWNFGVFLGVAGILLGDSTGLTWLEFPRYATPLLLVAYALFGGCVFTTFRCGKTSPLYVSQWYLFSALFWFPWIYTVAQVLLVYAPVRGTLQALVNSWFIHNVFGLWITPVGLAVIYYFIPKLTGRPIRHYYMASLAFWWLVVFSSLTGAASLIGGPVPIWAQAAGSAATFMLIVPLVIIGLNFSGSLWVSDLNQRGDLSLRFIRVAVYSFLIVMLLQVIISFRSVAEFTQFTFIQKSISQLGMYGFFSMAIFGAGYYILPRVLWHPFPSSVIEPLHFWSSVVGLGLVFFGWLLAGLQQVSGVIHPEMTFVAIGAEMRPFLFTASLGALLLTVGHIAFIVRFALSLSAATSSDGIQSSSALRSATR